MANFRLLPCTLPLHGWQACSQRLLVPQLPQTLHYSYVSRDEP